MATVSDVSAQSSFTAVKSDFDSVATAGTTGVIDVLKDIVSAAITAIGSQAYLLDADFTAEDIALVSPLIGTAGTNVLHDRVISDIETGQFGIDPNIEDQVFERSREREARLLASAVDGANRMFSSGGFTQPTGAANAAIEALRAEARDKIVSANREQTIKHADLYLAGKKIAIDAGVAIDQTNATVFTAAVDKFFKVFSLKVDQFKAQVQAQAALATAGMSGLNVNFGLSVGATANVGGSETVSETEDKSAGVTRRSVTESTTEDHNYDETKGTDSGETTSHTYTHVESP
jgi:hypothetical protein